MSLRNLMIYIDDGYDRDGRPVGVPMEGPFDEDTTRARVLALSAAGYHQIRVGNGNNESMSGEDLLAWCRGERPAQFKPD